jgi:hypothetical protein
MLEHESGIDPGIIEERGYSTVRSRAELLDFQKYQRRAPALRIPMYSPDGATTSAQIRPDNPRKGKKGKPVKYETRGGSEVILDVHPRMRTEVRSGPGPLWITEGIKKADALASRGLPAIGLIGVWMWCVPKEEMEDSEGPKVLKPCFDHVRLDGRRVNVVFDSDVMVKEGVQLALQRLVEALEARGADVYVVYLPDLGDGKTGVDDYLAAGHTVAELRLLARTFEAADIGEIRASRDTALRDALNGAWASWWGFGWSRLVGTGTSPHWKRGYSARDVEFVAIETAARSGVVVEDGIYFSLDVRSWAERSKVAKPTVIKSVRHLRAEGRLRVWDGDLPEGSGRGYVLLTGVRSPRAGLYQDGKREYGRERSDSLPGLTSDPTGKGLRAPLRAPHVPRLRWSAPRFYRENGVLCREQITRPGKQKGAVVDHLEGRHLGELEVSELALALGKRTRDLKRRDLPPLLDLGLIQLDGDTVRLAPGWHEVLELERERGGELEAERLAKARHKTEREAFRTRNARPADPSPTEADMDRAREERERRHREARERPVSYLAGAMRIYLDKYPHHAEQPANWITTAMWADGWLDDTNPSPAESKAALAELGGRAFLEGLARERAA